MSASLSSICPNTKPISPHRTAHEQHNDGPPQQKAKPAKLKNDVAASALPVFTRRCPRVFEPTIVTHVISIYAEGPNRPPNNTTYLKSGQYLCHQRGPNRGFPRSAQKMIIEERKHTKQAMKIQTGNQLLSYQSKRFVGAQNGVKLVNHETKLISVQV